MTGAPINIGMRAAIYEKPLESNVGTRPGGGRVGPP